MDNKALFKLLVMFHQWNYETQHGSG